MGNIINFNERAKEKETKNQTPKEEMVQIPLPTKKEISVVNAICNTIPEDEMPDIRFWNGQCWEGLFRNALEPYAKENGFNVWDVFAVLLMKINGAKFTEHDDGSISLEIE